MDPHPMSESAMINSTPNQTKLQVRDFIGGNKSSRLQISLKIICRTGKHVYGHL